MTYQAPDINLLTLLPLALVALAGMALLLESAFGSAERQARLPYLALISVGVTALATVGACLTTQAGSFLGALHVDRVTLWFWFLFEAATALTVLLASEHLRDSGAEHHELYGLLLLACLGMMLMAAGGTLVTVFVGLETMSIALYILAAMAGQTDDGSNEAALKYLLLGAFATGFLVYGMAFVYGATGCLDLAGISTAIAKHRAHTAFLHMGLALLVIGLGFKVALVPFHMWAPDVYEGAPTVVTAFMAVGPKLAGFAAMFRVFSVACGGAREQWAPVLAGLAVLTMVVGNLAALTQTNIKRLLAYSSIAHAGYLALGIMAGGGLGWQALLYYAATYTFLSMAAFAVVLVVNGPRNDRLEIDAYRGLAQRAPFAAGCLALALIGMSGLPPTSGFAGKLLLFGAAVNAGHVWVAVIGVLGSAISVYYYFRIVMLMYMQRPAEGAGRLTLGPATQRVLVATLAATILLSLPLCLPFWRLAGWCVGLE